MEKILIGELGCIKNEALDAFAYKVISTIGLSTKIDIVVGDLLYVDQDLFFLVKEVSVSKVVSPYITAVQVGPPSRTLAHMSNNDLATLLDAKVYKVTDRETLRELKKELISN
jgi:hypothetical protein